MDYLYALVIYAATGTMSSTDSVALTTVTNVPSYAECQQAGKAASDMANGTYKNIKFICVRTKK